MYTHSHRLFLDSDCENKIYSGDAGNPDDSTDAASCTINKHKASKTGMVYIW